MHEGQRVPLLQEFIAASSALATGDASYLLRRGGGCASQQNWIANVRFGSLADIEARLADVRFTPKSGH
jgi:hypothetical protein